MVLKLNDTKICGINGGGDSSDLDYSDVEDLEACDGFARER